MEEASRSTLTSGESQRIKEEIARFLREDRLRPKLEKLKDGDDEGRRKLIDAHDPATWLADAARRVTQIQQVTHAVKFTHPSADGSSLYCVGNPTAIDTDVGTHTVCNGLTPDVVGNAAALDVYKFLRLSVDNRTLLDRAKARDSALLDALSDDAGKATDWVAAFASMTEATGRPTSHTLTKQLYWPIDPESYHLLAPLFSSPLAHAVHKRIADDRFSDAAKTAREAGRSGKAHSHGYCVYPKLGIQNFGGSKPQNISQLNSERRGENYLLASVPPLWKSAAIRPPFNIETVFDRHFDRRTAVKRIVGTLRSFLTQVSKVSSNARIRDTRSELVADLCGETQQMAAELSSSLMPGWTAQRHCKLNLAEQCWLDADRRVVDSEFASLYRRGEWQEEVSLRFANWLNARLRTDEMHLGSAEAAAWQAALGDELKLLREDLGNE